MKQRETVNLYNYELFYLDFLEGNLNEEDQVQLLAFLEKYPALKLNDENIPQLPKVSSQLDETFKQLLKMVDVETDEISLNNYEQFLISEAEQTISQNGKAKIDAFIQQHPALEKDRRIYQSTRLKPDQSIVFSGKEALLKTRQLNVWRIGTAAAASVLLIFLAQFFVTTNSLNQPHKITHTAKNRSNGTKSSKHTQMAQVVQVKQTIQEKPNPIIREKQQQKLEKQPLMQAMTEQLPELPKREISAITERNAIDYEKLLVATTPLSADTPPINQKNDGTLSFSEMDNPIKPLTKRLEKAINTEVDFRMAKKTTNRSGGFLIRIGTLELSFNNH